MLKELTPTATNLIRDWETKKAAATAATIAEREARDAVVAHVFGADAAYGTNNFELGGGFKLKYVRSVNYTLDKSPVDPNDPTEETKVDEALDAIERSGNEGAFIVSRLVKFTPELSVTEYKKLSPALKAIIDPVITTKDASPSLSLEAPKK